LQKQNNAIQRQQQQHQQEQQQQQQHEQRQEHRHLQNLSNIKTNSLFYDFVIVTKTERWPTMTGAAAVTTTAAGSTKH
jgi:hypothetical protein